MTKYDVICAYCSNPFTFDLSSLPNKSVKYTPKIFYEGCPCCGNQNRIVIGE